MSQVLHQLHAQHLACVRGQRVLWAGLGFSLGTGQALWVRGRNGSGKTSLLRVLCGLAEPAEGQLHWCGLDVHRHRAGFQQQVLWLGHAGGLKDDLSPLENLHHAARIAGQAPTLEALQAALARMGLRHASQLPVGLLSQGQRRRVALARLFVEPTPPLWVLDEPFTALDTTTIAHLVQRLENHLAAGGLLIYTTHQPQRIRSALPQCVLDLDALAAASQPPRAPAGRPALPATEPQPC